MLRKSLICCLGTIAFAAAAHAALPLVGVNLAGAEFGDTPDSPDSNGIPIPILPGTYGTTYTYPNQNEVDYYLGKGMNTFRLPFLWERLEPDLGTGAFDADQLGYITDFVSQTTAKGGYVILDPHDFGQYVIGDTGYAIGSPQVSVPQFSAFWGNLAANFAGNDHVIFNLMNEPAGAPLISTADWFTAAQSAVNAIRGAGAANTILVPGNYYTGAWSWTTGFAPNASNADVLATYGAGGLDDPGVNGSGKNLVYEVHQYFDSNYSGSTPFIDHPDVAALFSDFTAWLNLTGNKGFLGEFGVSANLAGGTAQQDAVTATLDYLEANSNVWTGWTWWAGGPWWGNYDFSLEPTGLGQPGTPVDAPQMAYLAPYLPAAVPEPRTWQLLALAAAGAGIARIRKASSAPRRNA